MSKPKMKLVLVPVEKPANPHTYMAGCGCGICEIQAHKSSIFLEGVSARDAQMEEVDVKELAEFISGTLFLRMDSERIVKAWTSKIERAINDFMEGK